LSIALQGASAFEQIACPRRRREHRHVVPSAAQGLRRALHVRVHLVRL
jgi:hypothetical protein